VRISRADLLLLHELRVGAIVDDVLAEDGRGQGGIDLLGAHIANLAVENELVAQRADTDGRLASEEDEGEDIAVLY